MGVMECHRRGCDQIMCDRYSSEYGYICNECFSELEELRDEDNEISIAEFMNTKKGSLTEKNLPLNKIFTSRDDEDY